MSRIIFLFFIFLSYTSYSQYLKNDSLNNYLNGKNLYIQTDLLLPAFVLISNNYWSRQSTIYNITVGYIIKKSVEKRIKKSVQIDVYSYTEKNNRSYTLNTRIVEKEFDFFVSPEIKLLFNKTCFDKGFYVTAGLGAGTHKRFVDNKLNENSHSWDLLGSVGYNIPVKRFYFDFKLGAGTYFSYKIVYHNLNSTYNVSTEYMDSSLKKIEYINSSTIAFKYKYLGLMKATFIPNFGVHFGFRF